MTNKKRKNALEALKKDITAQAHDNVEKIKEEGDSTPSKKPKSRTVSNIPWYPKSKELKRELKLIALYEGSSVTKLIDEGIKVVLEKRGKNIEDYL